MLSHARNGCHGSAQFTAPCVLVLLIFFAACTKEAATSQPAGPQWGAAGVYPTATRPFGWRGDGTGRFPGATPPLNFSATQNVKWSVSVDESYSSPILTEKCILITAEPDLLICLERGTGRQLWKVSPPALKDPKQRDAAAAYLAPKDGAGLAAATPATDGATVYALFANGLVHAVDLDGHTKWTAYIDAEQSTGYGRSASPLLFGGKLFVHMTNLYALDPATGRQLWVNTTASSGYGTPLGMNAGGVDLIVTPGGDVVRVDDGKTVNTRIGRLRYPSPVVHEGVIYFGDTHATAVRVDAAFKDQELWSGLISGDVIASPLCHNGILYNVNINARLFAFRLDGKGEQTPLIERRALEPVTTAPTTSSGQSAKVYASLTLAGQYLYLPTTNGDLMILEATPEAKLLKKIRMPAGSPSTPIFCGKEMYLRAGDTVYCISE